MLPFLQPKKIVSVISSRRGKNPDIEVNPEVEAPDSKMDPALKMAAEDLMRAVESKSVIDTAKALRDAFQALESAPHEENEE